MTEEAHQKKRNSFEYNLIISYREETKKKKTKSNNLIPYRKQTISRSLLYEINIMNSFITGLIFIPEV